LIELKYVGCKLITLRNRGFPVSAGFQKALVKTKCYPNLANQTCTKPCAMINNPGYTALGPKFTVLETNAAKTQTKA
jgi:hypothetical protein